MEKDACPGPKPTNGFLNLPFAETTASNPEQPNIPSLSEQTTSPAHNPTTTRTTRSRSKSPQLTTQTTLPPTKPAKRHSQTSLFKYLTSPAPTTPILQEPIPPTFNPQEPSSPSLNSNPPTTTTSFSDISSQTSSRPTYTPKHVPPKSTTQPSDQDMRTLIWNHPDPTIPNTSLKSILTQHKIAVETINSTQSGPIIIVFKSQQSVHEFNTLSTRNFFIHPNKQTPIDLSSCLPPPNILRINHQHLQSWYVIHRDDLKLLLNSLESHPTHNQLHIASNNIFHQLKTITPNITSVKLLTTGKTILTYSTPQPPTSTNATYRLNLPNNTQITLHPDLQWTPPKQTDPRTSFCNICCNVGHTQSTCPKISKKCKICGSDSHHCTLDSNCPQNKIHPRNKDKSKIFCVLCLSPTHNAGNRKCPVLQQATTALAPNNSNHSLLPSPPTHNVISLSPPTPIKPNEPASLAQTTPTNPYENDLTSSPPIPIQYQQPNISPILPHQFTNQQSPPHNIPLLLNEYFTTYARLQQIHTSIQSTLLPNQTIHPTLHTPLLPNPYIPSQHHNPMPQTFHPIQNPTPPCISPYNPHRPASPYDLNPNDPKHHKQYHPR